MTEDAAATVDFRQRQVAEAISGAEAQHARLSRRAAMRRSGGYVLKSIAAFGGVAVAAGLPEKAAHVVGIAIAVATVADVSLARNHERLLGDVRAESAYARLLADVKHQYNMDLAPILRSRSDPAVCLPQLDALCKRTLTLLHEGRRRIDEAITANDLTQLAHLSLEKETKE